MRCFELISVLVVLMTVGSSMGYSMDLAALLKGRHNQMREEKRKQDGGNPCTDPETPFPCKMSDTCIPMGFVCDDSCDCDEEDCYDEDPEVCTAVHRPPVVDIMHFLDMEKSWILPALFGNKPIAKIAHGLAVSQTVDDFKRRLGLSKGDVQHLREALSAVRQKSPDDLARLGMPATAWNEVNFVFTKLIKSGFQ